MNMPMLLDYPEVQFFFKMRIFLFTAQFLAYTNANMPTLLDHLGVSFLLSIFLLIAWFLGHFPDITSSLSDDNFVITYINEF